MTNDQRDFIPGATDLSTLKTERNAPLFRVESNVRLLGEAIRKMKPTQLRAIDAIVLLPDPLHTIWSLPPDDADDPVAPESVARVQDIRV